MFTRVLNTSFKVNKPSKLFPKNVNKSSLNFQLLRCFSTEDKHEMWRDENDTDNIPMVKRRDGTVAPIDKTRGFVDYHRNAEPYREPMERIFDWNEINYSVIIRMLTIFIL